jgi:para-aminobenzoate synthetase/4-amino-4-deoxychorismate lyase
VTVPDPFVVETYPTLHTMVSGVEAALRENLGPVDILETMFPCGSITGAPKVRAGQIINELERAGRGIYTGSIGWIAPGGDARFNVAIRTAVIEGQRLSLGVGAGIVSDSVPADEWRECQTKAAFLTARARPFHLIETMRFVPSEGVANLDLHMQRLEKSAGYFGRPFDEQRAVRDLESVTSLLSAPSRIRMLLDQDGRVAVSASPIPPSKPVLDITVAPLPVPPDDWRLFHKSSDRAFYDQARQDSDADEVVFERPDGLLTEGSFTNLFVRRGSRLLTPHAASGLLPGILRARLIADRKAVEADLTVDDLRGGEVFVGNALRGLVPAHHVARRQGAS